MAREAQSSCAWQKLSLCGGGLRCFGSLGQNTRFEQLPIARNRPMLSKLERKLGRFALPNLTLFLIVGQVLVYTITQVRPRALENIQLVPAKVLEGDIWRLFTFLVQPPETIPIFAFFFWYLFYLMGTALEHQWGVFRYNVFLLIGYVATVAAAFLVPQATASNVFLEGSVFLAFAYLYPNFELYLFFILPVKIKWFAMFAWIGYFLQFAYGDWSTRAMIAASVLNFFVFFGRDVLDRIHGGRRRMAWQAKQIANQAKPFHRCMVCGITDKSHPQMEFRYCSQCAGACGYCTEHIRNHEHVTQQKDTVQTQ
jgi:hypothetical protein